MNRMSDSGSASRLGHGGRAKGNGGSGSSPSTLQDVARELGNIRFLVAASQQQSAIAQRRAEVQSVTNARLRRKLESLSKQLERARRFAYHDELTGLPNRGLLMDRLQQAMGQSLRQQNQVAVLLISPNGFDGMNDLHGQGTAERLLVHMARVLRSCLRATDTVCHYGGADFVLLLHATRQLDGATRVVRLVCERLAGSFLVNGAPIPVAINVGLALFPRDGGDCDELLNHADIGLHQNRITNSMALGTVS